MGATGTDTNRRCLWTGVLLFFNDEMPLERDGGGQVEPVRRRGLNDLVDLFELLRRCAALDVDRIAQVVVASLHRGIDAEDAAKVDIAFGFDSQFLEFDALQGTDY